MENTIDDVLKAKLTSAVIEGVVTPPLRAHYDQVIMGLATARSVAAGVDNGAVIYASADNSVVSLPAAATCPGQDVTVVNAAADGAALLTLTPVTADKILGGIAAVRASGVAGTGFVNTKATAKQGDYCHLVSDGVHGWWIVGGIGVWAVPD